MTFADALPSLTNLKVLGLSNSNIIDDVFTTLASGIMSMETCNINRLYLDGNYIGDDGMLSLVVMLSSEHVKIEVLHLGNNLFTSDGLIVLASAIESTETMRHLFLNDNELFEDGVEALGNSLSYNRSLNLLSLPSCNITDE